MYFERNLKIESFFSNHLRISREVIWCTYIIICRSKKKKTPVFLNRAPPPKKKTIKKTVFFYFCYKILVVFMFEVTRVLCYFYLHCAKLLVQGSKIIFNHSLKHCNIYI